MAFAPHSPIPEVIHSPPSEDTAMPPERHIPPSLMAGRQIRPMTPSFHITPPSDEGISHESHHESYQSQSHHSYAIHESQQPQYAQVIHPDPAMSPGNAERTTVMVYSNSDSVDPHGSHGIPMPMSEPGFQRVPSRTTRTSAGPPVRQSTITIQTPIRQSNPPPPPPMGAQAPLSQAPPSQDPQTILEGEDTVLSPATERLPPTADYRKMPNFPNSPSRRTTWTRTTATSWYDPSWASQRLTPVERFFKTLYHLPWVSHGRVTIDYRPGAGLQGKGKYKAGVFKKPMSSWYKRLSRSGKSQELDLLSSGTMYIPDMTRRTGGSLDTMSSIPASPRSGRTGRRRTSGDDLRHNRSGGHSSGHRRHRHRHHHHRRRRSMSTIEEPSDQRNGSPALPVYSYPYPAYPYGTYPGYAPAPPGMPLTPGITGMPATPPISPGAAQQGFPMQMIAAPVPMPAAQAPREHRSSSKRSPRGPRTRGSGSRAPAYPNGYAPYQAMAFPPQVLYQGTPPTPGGQATMTPGVGPQQQPQLVQYVPVPMQVVPGAFNPAQADYFQSASSIPSPPSSPTPRAGSTAPPAAP
ncbi:hypothetical protein NMY22_g7446 [Coprinellus aureogranulatus]|nr:hypothetical protein NMY22_g7446 [Coprinellus aureogranulatus]